MPKTLLNFDLKQYTFSGTPEKLGHAHGETLKEPIRELIETRFSAAESYFRLEGSYFPSLIQTLQNMGRTCLNILKKLDHDGFVEHNAIANAAHVDPVDLYTATNYTDIRDAVMLSKKEDEEGCTAFIIPPNRTENGHLLAGQTWDLDPADIKFVVAIRHIPNKGPERWNILVAGSLALMGINSSGISVGTTNLKTWHSAPGLGYLNLIHKALRCESISEAGNAIEKLPKAGAHSFWITDKDNGLHYEATSIDYSKKILDTQPFGWSNHCLNPIHQKYEYNAPTKSSQARYDRMQTIFQTHDKFSIDSIRQIILENRQDSIDSINRYPEDTKITATNACVISDPGKRQLHACRGPSDRGEWHTLSFD